MQKDFFMQLLIILALLLYGSKSGSQKLLTEVKPVLESLGGEQIREAIKSAEEISAMLTAVSELTGANASGSIFGGGNQNPAAHTTTANDAPADAADDAIAFPLKPIGGIADRDITYSLSRYISEC